MDRFWSKVNKTNACWLWQGCIVGGYGQIRINKKLHYTHRIAYQLHYGPIPSDKYVLHKCDVRNCVNPDHLWLGTHQDNMDDKMQKGRHVVPVGEKCNLSKLTEKDVLNIRRVYRKGWTQQQIADRYDVGRTAISAIIRRVNWKHI